MDAISRRPARGRVVLILALAAAIPLLAGASHSTPNFSVEAPTPEIARRIGEHAETCRKSVAQAWLGHDLAAWKTRCPIKVRVTDGEAGGLTSFGFAAGRVADQVITLEGRVDRILASALPHEITHTVFAAYFGGPMPRWADEGASLLSEDEREIRRHDQIVLDLLGRRGDLPLQTLFRVEEYPKDLMGFYGQGYSVSRFLIEMGGRPRFLKFVKDGHRQGWDVAAKEHYGLANCRELDRAWRSWHKVVMETRPAPGSSVLLRAQSADE
jgi:hypothetical protein